MSLSYEIDTGKDRVRILLAGRIDREAGDVLESACAASIASSPPELELDFGSVDYINSTGIALIVGVLARARAQRVPMRAAGLTAHYQHIFEITRLSDFIEIVRPVGS